MESIRINGTDRTPTVDFCSSGELSITGRIIGVNAQIFFSPLIRFCEKLLTNEVYFEAKLEYVKSSALKTLYELLHTLEENNNVKVVTVSWYYEDGDETMLEIGKVYSEIFSKLKFKFISCDEKVFF